LKSRLHPHHRTRSARPPNTQDHAHRQGAGRRRTEQCDFERGQCHRVYFGKVWLSDVSQSKRASLCPVTSPMPWLGAGEPTFGTPGLSNGTQRLSRVSAGGRC
jgi:hypothetical protein